MHDEETIEITRESFERTLTPGQYQIFDEHAKNADELISMGRTAVGDLEQHAGNRAGTTSHWLPPLLTHGAWYNFKLDKMATIQDTCLAQGLDSIGQGPLGQSPVVPLLLECPRRHAHRMLGNGLNVQVFLRFLVFMFGHCERNSQAFHNPIARPPVNTQPAAEESDAEDSDEAYQQQMAWHGMACEFDEDDELDDANAVHWQDDQ